MVSFILPPPGRFSVGHQSPFPPFGLQEPPPPPFFRGHGSQVSPLPLPLAGVPPPPPPVSSPLLFSMDAVVQSGVSFSSNKAPGLLGPPPGRFSPGGSGVACQQFPMEQSAAFRSQVPDPGETWRSQPRSINQNSWDSDPSWSLPYPPRGYGPVSGTGSRWTAPYPPLSGQHFHAYPEPSLGNIFGVTGTVPPFPPVSQQGGGDQRAPPQAGFLGHLTASTPVPAPAGVLPQPLCNLPSPNSNVFSRPVSQAQSSSLVVPAGMDRSPSRSQQGGEAECAAVQQESQPGGSRDEGGAGVVLQEAQGADGFSVKKTRIWVVGHSFIFWAAKHRIAERWSGFTHPVDIRWLGKRGMVWAALIPTLGEEIEVHGTPDIVVIHLGGNDVGKGKSLDLIINIREDLAQIHARWPSMKVCWSNIIPRLSWRSSIPPATLIKVVKKINGYARQNIRGTQGVVISHPGLTVDKRHLFRADGVHLSPVGTVLFIERIFSELKGLVFSLGGGPRGP
ncbi:uncharacterized protein LOC142099473 isoform X3 [Mixophyes fleayi]|uniref:uncharacterized protein LOC142099473 isoform X3 n=1 Tax=Mixophyes fleayi TaxID=3061075 RepID=UPI003F4DB451